jgi:alkylation response protein AidB-like acyl-CoA dehydrogenase
MGRQVFTPEHEALRATVAGFVRDYVQPNMERWNADGAVDRELYKRAADLGLVGFAIDERFGGAGIDDFRFSAVITEEFARAGTAGAGLGIGLINDICLPYLLSLGTEEQQARWLPGVAAGDTVLAIAMTEPGAGSDLSGIRTTARRDGDHYVVDGAKTFISSGQTADLVIVVVRTGEHPHRGLSLLVVESGTPGFERGRRLSKVGLHAQDTSELFFHAARVPAANLLGSEGGGFAALMANLATERLGIAVTAVAAAEGTFARTLEYARERTAFGRPIGSFQNTRFTLAEIRTELAVGRAFVDDCVRRHVAGELSAEDAAAAKWWTTDLQVRVADRCVQVHGGYGYMTEYQVARDFLDARVQPIYGGTNEIMKEIVGRGLGL